MVPKMGACLKAVTEGVPRATVVDGRAARRPGRDFTDEGVGTQVLPGVATKAPQGEREPHMSTGDDVAAALRRSADQRVRPAQAGADPRPRAHVWDADGNEYVDLLGGSRSTRSGTLIQRSSTRSPGSSRTLGHVSNFFTSEPQVELAERLLELLPAPHRPGGCSSPTPAPRPTRRRSSCPGGPAGPTWWPRRAPSTAGRWDRWP